MTLQAAILAYLMTLTPSSYDTETRDERGARMAVVADAVAAESGSVQRASYAIAVMDRESRFDKIIHAGGAHPKWRQDGGRSTCLAQIHRSGIRNNRVWARLAGTDIAATRLCVRWSLELLARYRHCLRRPGAWTVRHAMMFSSYGTGGAGCGTDAKGRAKATAYSRAYRYLVTMTD